MHKKGFYQNYFKRIFDILLSFFAILVLSPLLIAISLIVLLKLGKPFIFVQERSGLKGKPFSLYKFRTMTNETDASGNLLPDKQRITKLGKVLRATSLDELPELFNILKGDMSIVGPRPLLPKYLSFFTDFENHRLSVRPGLTGLAQISGRNGISWRQRFQLDYDYVRSTTLFGDIRIIVSTITVVMNRKNINFEKKESIYDYFMKRDGGM